MTVSEGRISRVVSIAGPLGFALGLLPLAALTFFSPGLRAEGARGLAVFAGGVATLILLILGAMRRKWLWILVVLQLFLLGGVLIETFSDGVLYIGT